MHTIIHTVLRALILETTGVPIYVQLRDQFLRLIGNGTLKPSAQMPTMRQVAVTLKIDLNTVRRAYEALERAGAITLTQGRGSFVADHPPTNPAGDDETLTRLAEQTIAQARTAGIDPAALAERISRIALNKEHTS